ncbi:adhesion G-protein coupled receptor G7 [Toxotes jaculatrix]|uniref:adhesion G-protein coupled receptor G7 n=1 Tax=Toxotes jaculatrix TaxID=941984 RepID=UPI001B3B1A96|nr:adhesion G-protein coupled receptor G7 [Toxotes jaculatrix]
MKKTQTNTSDLLLFINMDLWFFLVFTMAVPLASRTEGLSTTTSNSTSITSITSSPPELPIPVTTATVLVTTSAPITVTDLTSASPYISPDNTVSESVPETTVLTTESESTSNTITPESSRTTNNPNTSPYAEPTLEESTVPPDTPPSPGTTPLLPTSPYAETTEPIEESTVPPDTPPPPGTTPLLPTSPYAETTELIEESTVPPDTPPPPPPGTTPLLTTSPYAETTEPIEESTLPPDTPPPPPGTTPLLTTSPYAETTEPIEESTVPPDTPPPPTPLLTTSPPTTTTSTPPFSTTPYATTTATTRSPTTTLFTTITSTTTPPTTTPLVCVNGGILLNGVCICPDEWTGETCSVENFCKAEVLNEFRFPPTPVGWFAYSEEVCPQGTSNAGKPQAVTRCSNTTGSLGFNRPPQVVKCDQTFSDIQQNIRVWITSFLCQLTSVADLDTLATSTQILTSRPEELTAENVTAAAQIVNTLLLSPNATESVRVAAVATVSQLLNASAPDNTEENSATLGLTVTLDQLSVNLSTSLNTSQSQVVQPNLVVQSVLIPAADTQGVQFTSLTGTSGSFVADRIQLNTNTSNAVVEGGIVVDTLIYVQFPPEAAGRRQKPSNVSLGFVLYQNDRFFRSRLYRGRHATIRVLSASVKGQDRSVVPQHVEMLFRPTLMDRTSLHDFACVFWNYSVEDWSTAGCSKGNASDGVMRCFCNHTTNFAALWSYRATYEYAHALDLISIVGLSLSIVGFAVTIIHHIIDRESLQNNRNMKMALLCICVSLLAFVITFLSGVENSSREDDAGPKITTQTNNIPDSDQHVEQDGGSCTAVAALLHFFLLATFMWNSVYSTQLVLLESPSGDGQHKSLPKHWTLFSIAAGWGVPAIVMAITLGATYRVDNPLGYRQEEFCWLAALDKDKDFKFDKPMFWGFLLPVGLTLIYNMVLLVLTMRARSKSSSLRKKFLKSFSLAVLLGLSWSLGYLVLITSGHAHQIFSIFFCLCTTTQGFQIFILFTARTPAFKATVSRSVQYVSSVNIPLQTMKYRVQKNWGRKTSPQHYKDLMDEHASLD